ncbi:hypothetical protein BRC92_08725 [Halobacteriales archaeon QS_4_69_31]|nr:MAG: hypothetical protein BRC92_08725 [Halobacteriales archaeon QS_4_69_31]
MSVQFHSPGGSLRFDRTPTLPFQAVCLCHWDSQIDYRTTVGWSLLSSGVVTPLLVALPGDSL